MLKSMNSFMITQETDLNSFRSILTFIKLQLVILVEKDKKFVQIKRLLEIITTLKISIMDFLMYMLRRSKS